MNIPVKAEVIKRTDYREYLMELNHRGGIAYGRFTHVGDQRGEFEFTKGTVPPVDATTVAAVKEEIRRFEILGHASYKENLRR